MKERPTLRSTLHAWLYLTPAFAILGVFTLYPIVKAFDVSLYTKYNYFKNIVYERGFDNYVAIVHDPLFWLSLRNTFILVLGTVPVTIAISLFIAVLLTSSIKGRAFFRSVYFLPVVTSVIAISMVWRWMYHTDYGLINAMLGSLGVSPIGWLTSPDWAMPSLIILCIWKGLGYNIIIFLAGLQSIDRSMYIAARMDGARSWQRFWRITVPLLSPTTFYIAIVSVIVSFKVFDEVFALFGGLGGHAGPGRSAMTIVYYIFEKFYSESKYGMAAAASYVLLGVTLLFTLLQMYIGRKRVHY
ncbi:carbohydrate ABC transporter permease [Paenibacillus sp. YYML68]|uniref:carbohydrate ABC transporter permease n=1 Tax=Paenibacillus sp. YYML68 TaxID=2909250 RepID=UPI002493211C|nr:sugar ABC transporter permease [Paenibacillus sp. YYML68]